MIHMPEPNLSGKNRLEMQKLVKQNDIPSIKEILDNSTTHDFIAFLKKVEQSRTELKKKKERECEQLARELDEKINALRSEVRDLERENESLGYNMDDMKDSCIHIVKEILHSNLNLNLKNRIINTLADVVGEDFLSSSETNISKGSFVSPEIVAPISALSGHDSVLTHPYSENRVQTMVTPFGKLWMAYDKPSTTADTMRTHHASQSISMAICDGAGGYGDASKIYSRVISGLIVEQLPLSRSASILIHSRPTFDLVVNCLGNNKFGKSPLSRTLDLQTFQNLCLESGKSTALNVIVQGTGYFWFSGIGDTHLAKLSGASSANPVLSSVYETNNDSEETRLIGIRHGNAPSTSPLVSADQLLSVGDYLVGMTDHTAKFAAEKPIEFKDGVRSIVTSRNKAELVFAWDNLLSQIGQLDTDDDTSLLIFGTTQENVEIQKEEIEDVDNSLILFKQERFRRDTKDYFVAENRLRGLKRIPLIAASNLVTLKHELKGCPTCFPSYEIFQHKDNPSDFFILMEHLSGDDYQRLDKAINELKNSDDVEGLLAQIELLEQQLTEKNLSHGDFAPPNIFVSKSGVHPPKIIDLNTVYFHGAFPHTSERGHSGMHGGKFLPAIPSLNAHTFAYEVLKFTLKVIQSYDDQGIQSFVEENVPNSLDETYLLDSDLLDQIFLDINGNGEPELVQRIQEMYPKIATEEIVLFLSNARMSSIFKF